MRDFEIQIRDLRVHARIGTTDEEQMLGQSLLVHLRLGVRAPLASDDLDQTLDYGAVVHCVREFADGMGRVKLVETFTSAMMDELMKRFPGMHSISARVQKSYVPVRDFTGHISVEMSCTRS